MAGTRECSSAATSGRLSKAVEFFDAAEHLKDDMPNAAGDQFVDAGIASFIRPRHYTWCPTNRCNTRCCVVAASDLGGYDASGVTSLAALIFPCTRAINSGSSWTGFHLLRSSSARSVGIGAPPNGTQ